MWHGGKNIAKKVTAICILLKDITLYPILSAILFNDLHYFAVAYMASVSLKATVLLKLYISRSLIGLVFLLIS